jgi:DNA mismatch repair protein MutL
MTSRDGHIRVLPLHVANKIAAGEVVERPASVVKELVENAIDAGATAIRISITQGGRKLVSVQDDGCGMTRDDAALSLERQATSKILDVNDIEEIDTLGFRGEAIPSIASVSRFSLTTRRHNSDEGTFLQVNAGTLAEIRAAGCPPGTLVEVRDLFCNVPARRKFLRAYATEESHIKHIFTVHALAHPGIGFTLVVDGRELYRLAPSSDLRDRIRDIFGPEFIESLLPLSVTQTPKQPKHPNTVSVTGFIERPNLATPTRRDQYIFINGRPATSPSIAYAIREAYPRHQGDVKPAAILFLELPPNQVDVNVHPTKREVRFRDNVAVKRAIIDAIEGALGTTAPQFSTQATSSREISTPVASQHANCDRFILPTPGGIPPRQNESIAVLTKQDTTTATDPNCPHSDHIQAYSDPIPTAQPPAAPKRCEGGPNFPTSQPPAPVETELPLASTGTTAKPWTWFKFLATTASGYLLIETDAGVVTVNPYAARERIAFEQLTSATQPQTPKHTNTSQGLLIPETVHLSPTDSARVKSALVEINEMGFKVEEFGRDTFKIDAVPQLIGSLSPSAILSTIAHDLAESGTRRGGDNWRAELVAKSIARSFAGSEIKLNEELATRLVEELSACRMPYVCPRGKPIMIFTSTRELNRKFARD